MDTDGKFYLGRIYDIKTGKTTENALLYDPEDLTTHAVVVGMTGSGKTGLCIGMLEEAALNNIPALLIDPKGDITNLLLHFPELLPEDFEPWVNPDEARKSGQTIQESAEALAALWRKGLGDWGIEPERLRRLKDSAHFAVYTPGSDAGIPVNILASFKAPSLPWDENREMLREKISASVTALLTLIGLTDIDPVRSREHILLSNIFENAWSMNQDLDLGELILQVQEPPFTKLGVFDINRFYPEKERFELAMMLNNILAAPAFQAWIAGEPLEIQNLLYHPDGRPRHSVFYIAHLSDQERMFFVTLLYSAVEAWMRTQPGTTSLRAIVYFDEIFGYLPPLKNPPSKQILLRLLKQARAFGVAQVLVTQNPVDLDYKAISNAGTWMIGKLQTDQDKQRLLDGLQGAIAGSMDRSEYDRLLSSLGKRVFLMHNVHEKGPAVFQTRWAMNYLAGPLTKAQIPVLNTLTAELPEVSPDSLGTQAGGTGKTPPAGGTVARETVPVEAAASVSGLARQDVGDQLFLGSPPPVPRGIDVYFLPNNLTLTEAFMAANQSYPEQAMSQGLLYRPAVIAQATVRYLNRKYNLDYDQKLNALIPEPNRRGVFRWEENLLPDFKDQYLAQRADPQARFTPLDAPLSEVKIMNAASKDFQEWVFRGGAVKVKANETLKVYAGPEVTQAEFRKMCSEAAKRNLDNELEKAGQVFDKKIAALENKIAQEQRELERDKAEYSQRKAEELGAGLDTLIGVFGGRRRSISKNLTKRRMTSTAKADIEESEDAIQEYKKQIADLEEEKTQALQKVEERWGEIAGQMTEITVQPLKKDVLLDFFGVAWFPYYRVDVGGKVIDLPGFAPGS